MQAQMTSTAWAQGIKNMLICGVGVLATWGALAAAITSYWDIANWSAGLLALAGVVTVSYAAFFAAWSYGRATAGRVLLDCGRHPTSRLFAVHAILFAVAGFVAAASALWPDLGLWYAGLGATFCLASACYWLIAATGRLQIRENGLWTYWGLVPWRKITMYRWANDSTLVLRASGPLNFLQGAIPIPKQQQLAVDGYLQQLVPQ
jgi:hypothetical protein